MGGLSRWAKTLGFLVYHSLSSRGVRGNQPRVTVRLQLPASRYDLGGVRDILKGISRILFILQGAAFGVTMPQCFGILSA